MGSELTEKAEKRARALEQITKVVGLIAIGVYLVMSAIAAFNQAWIAIVFFTCLMLGVGVVYSLIQALLAHLEIIRSKE